VQLSTVMSSYSGVSDHDTIPNSGVPLIARVYLTLGTWKRALSPVLDDDSIQGMKQISLFSLVSPFPFI
jgi:serine/threonine-protein kinase mTOR